MRILKIQLIILLSCLGFCMMLNGNALPTKPENDLKLDPDLTPVLTIIPSTISGASTIGIAVTVTELNNEDTDGSPIIVRIPSDPRLSFVWGLPNPVPDWNYLGNNGFIHSFVYNGPGGIITKGSQSSFQIIANYDPQNTTGTTTISVSLVPFSGGEVNLTNNTDSESLVYFN